MNANDYRQYMLSHIKPWARPASGERQINCRCFYCPDSDTHSHGHFYISIPTSEQPSLYCCKKCNVSGLVTPIKLMDWGIYDSDVAIYLANLNKRMMGKRGSIYTTPNFINHINYTRISMSASSEDKLSYINNRLGLNMSYQDCLDLKIVLNLQDILEENRLKYTRDPRIIQALNTDFLGFLSDDRSSVNLRNVYMRPDIHPSLNKRYIKYNLIDIENNLARRFYTIPTMVHLDRLEPIKLHVAEGPFDILSILYNVRRNINQSIYAAIGGSSYRSVIEHFVTWLAVPNLEIHIYPDNDVPRDTIINIAEDISIFRYPVYIHRNVFPGEKDFGVPANRISESIESNI